jgi:hypothetical protein
VAYALLFSENPNIMMASKDLLDNMATTIESQHHSKTAAANVTKAQIKRLLRMYSEMHIQDIKAEARCEFKAATSYLRTSGSFIPYHFHSAMDVNLPYLYEDEPSSPPVPTITTQNFVHIKVPFLFTAAESPSSFGSSPFNGTLSALSTTRARAKVTKDLGKLKKPLRKGKKGEDLDEDGMEIDDNSTDDEKKKKRGTKRLRPTKKLSKKEEELEEGLFFLFCFLRFFFQLFFLVSFVLLVLSFTRCSKAITKEV